jgi:hypothetical protein
VDGWWTEIEAEIQPVVRLHPTVTLEQLAPTSPHIRERDRIDPARADDGSALAVVSRAMKPPSLIGPS